MMWQLMWRNVKATTLNAMLQLLVLYRYRFHGWFIYLYIYIFSVSQPMTSVHDNNSLLSNQDWCRRRLNLKYLI